MKKFLKSLGLSFLGLVLAFSSACSSGTTSSGDKDSASDSVSDSSSSPEPVEPVPPELSELLDDEYATASRGTKPEIPRFPEDEEWTMLLQKQQALKTGESFVETFDGNYFTSRLSAVSDGAQFEVIEGADAIEGKSLRMTTSGNYAGIRLTGAKFVAGGTYAVEMDYNVITASNDFFFQFRDATVGANSDVFATFGSSAGKGTLTHTFTLGMYSSYYIMIMPRNDAGEVVIDNIRITRLDSSPIASDLSLSGEIAVGSTVTASYEYTDYEGDPEGESEFVWFAALTDAGLNKMVLDNTGNTLEITEDMLGKYIGFQVIPVASKGDNAIGTPVLYMATESVGGTRPDYGSKFALAEGESFTEDFEADVGEDRNLIYVSHGGTDNYIYHDSDRNSNVLRIKSSGTYLGTDFSGISFAAGGVYRISFDYAFKTIPNTFYVQLRSSAGDSFYQLATDIAAGTWAKASGTLEIGNAEDAFLMMFPDASAVEILIDNLTIERLSEDDESIRNEPFNIRDRAVSENFSSVLNRQLYPEGKGGATVAVTAESGKAIDGNSVYVETTSAGDVVFRGANARGGELIMAEFSYSVLAGAQLSVGLTSDDGTEGTFVPVSDVSAGIKKTTVRVQAPEADKEYHLTVRLGGEQKLILDNINASWVDTEAIGDYESFEGTQQVYLRSAVNGAQLSVKEVSSGNVLAVTAPAGGGVKFAYAGVQKGGTYAVTFTYSVSAAEAGNKLLVRIGNAAGAEIDAAQGASGRKTVYLTADEVAEIYIVSAQAGTFTLDDVFIQDDSRTAGALSEAGTSQGLPAYDESGKYYVDVNNDSAVSFTNEARYQSKVSSGSVLLVESKGAYGGVQIRNSDWTYGASAKYRITMTYTVVSNPNGCEMYVQLGATSANVQFNGNDTAVGVQKTVTFELTAVGAWDCIMIFGGGGANGYTFTIDDFILEVVG